MGSWNLPVLSPDTELAGDESLALVQNLAASLPESVADSISRFKSRPPHEGVMLFTGLPLGEIPRTPPSPRSAIGKERVSETVLLTVASAFGHAVGYAPEHGGDLVQNIVPVASTADRQVSTSSKVRLEFHTEAAFHPHRPKYLLLLCLRGDPAAATTVCSVRSAIATLSDEVVSVLREPRFATGVDESYLGYKSEKLGAPIPAVSGPEGFEAICFDGDLMQGLDSTAADALEQLRSAIDATQLSVVLTAGDLLVVDNDIAVHGRSPFSPRFDGTDRWLQRTFVVTDLKASASERVGRIITTDFSA
jgi:L-asparagine oxygenase